MRLLAFPRRDLRETIGQTNGPPGGGVNARRMAPVYQDSYSPIRWIIQLLLPAILATFGSYVAVTSRLSALEVRMEERTASLRLEIDLLRRTHQQDVQRLEHADEKRDGMARKD